MQLDIRLPIGLLFGVLGAILTVYGVVSDKAIYDRSLGLNVNLWWGLVTLAFGVVMFLMGRRGTSAVRPADESAEGRAIEAREQAIQRKSRPHGH